MAHQPTLKVLLLATLVPTVALACPNCASGNDRLRNVLTLVAIFMTVPFLLVGAVIRAIRKAQAGSNQP